MHVQQSVRVRGYGGRNGRTQVDGTLGLAGTRHHTWTMRYRTDPIAEHISSLEAQFRPLRADRETIYQPPATVWNVHPSLLRARTSCAARTSPWTPAALDSLWRALGSGHVPRKRTCFHTEGLKLAAGRAGGVVSGEQGPLHASASGRCLT
jgi:hypothetical protein